MSATLVICICTDAVTFLKVGDGQVFALTQQPYEIEPASGRPTREERLASPPTRLEIARVVRIEAFNEVFPDAKAQTAEEVWDRHPAVCHLLERLLPMEPLYHTVTHDEVLMQSVMPDLKTVDFDDVDWIRVATGTKVALKRWNRAALDEDMDLPYVLLREGESVVGVRRPLPETGGDPNGRELVRYSNRGGEVVCEPIAEAA